MLEKYIPPIQAQRGVVLMITLIVLVAMTLAALTLSRSVDTSNLIAGNLAFQQAAIQSSDTGYEAAVDWLEANGNTGALQDIVADANYYSPSRQDPAINQPWDSFWNNLVLANRVVSLPADSSGNTVSYTIHRLCNQAGAPNAPGTFCSAPPSGDSSGNSKGSLVIALRVSMKVYYRITVRVDGPRNTVGYVQAIVAM